MYKNILFCFLFLFCITNWQQLMAAPCKTPTKTEFQAAPVDTLFCDSSYSKNYSVEATSLFRASYIGDIGWAKKEIERGANININIAPSGNTPLIAAVATNQESIVQLLLENGADPDTPRSDNGLTGASDGSTPLVLAAGRGNIEIVQLLLEYDAGPDIPSSDNGLTEYSDGSTPLLGAAANGHYEIVQLLLKYGADPNKANSTNRKLSRNAGITPLVLGIKNYKIVKLLLENGADPNKHVPYLLDDRGMSLLDYTKLWGNTATVRLLKQYGAKTSGRLNFFYRTVSWVRNLLPFLEARTSILAFLAALIWAIIGAKKLFQKWRLRYKN